MTLKTLYGMTEDDATMKVLRELEAAAAEKNFTVSRWVWGQGKYAKTITYIVHPTTTPRADQARYQDNAFDRRTLTTDEGKTKRSDAYKKLSSLLRVVQKMSKNLKSELLIRVHGSVLEELEGPNLSGFPFGDGQYFEEELRDDSIVVVNLADKTDTTGLQEKFLNTSAAVRDYVVQNYK